MIPEKPITWEGRPRWGWWLIDPRTRETIGVLDTGLHQAMMQRTILEAEGPMQSKMGAVLGAMVGAIDTYWVLMAMVLKHGELTKEALLEAKAYMKDIQSVLCPGFEKKVGVGASVNIIRYRGLLQVRLRDLQSRGRHRDQPGVVRAVRQGLRLRLDLDPQLYDRPGGGLEEWIASP